MKFTKYAAIVLCGALLMTGCGKKDNTPKEVQLPAEPVMTVGDMEVSNGIFNFFLDNYAEQSADKDSAKDMALDECESGYTRIAVAQKMNIEADDDAKADMENQKNQIKAAYGDSYSLFLQENGLTEEDIDTIISFGFYSDKLKEKMGDKEYSDEEKRDYFKTHYRRAKHVLIMIDDDTDDDAAKAKAEEVLEKAKSGGDFDTLIREYGEDPGMDTNTDGYVFTDGEMVQEFEDGVDSIEPGELTMVKTSYGYHVIKRLALDETPDYFEDAYANAEEKLEENMRDALFEEQLEKWAEEYGIKAVYNDEVINEIVNNQ